MSRICTDCFWCKINRSKGYIRCVIDNDNEPFSNWIHSDETEIIIKLKHSEINRSFIEWRNIFKTAQKCTSMKSMI